MCLEVVLVTGVCLTQQQLDVLQQSYTSESVSFDNCSTQYKYTSNDKKDVYWLNKFNSDSDSDNDNDDENSAKWIGVLACDHDTIESRSPDVTTMKVLDIDKLSKFLSTMLPTDDVANIITTYNIYRLSSKPHYC
jgi:hypothetical protein